VIYFHSYNRNVSVEVCSFASNYANIVKRFSYRDKFKRDCSLTPFLAPGWVPDSQVRHESKQTGGGQAAIVGVFCLPARAQ
jgi:hypothetical protein